jgi:hypothetical protein
MVMTLMASGKEHNMTESFDEKGITPLGDSELNNVSGGRICDICNKIRTYAGDIDAPYRLIDYARQTHSYKYFSPYLKRYHEDLYMAFNSLTEDEKHEFFNYYWKRPKEDEDAGHVSARW